MTPTTKGYVHKSRPLHEVTLQVVATAMGREPADLIIRNGRLVNVNVGRIQEGVDVVVREGIICLVGDSSHVLVDEHTQIVDAAGRYIAPGFIDTHEHVESSMIDVRSFAAAVLPEGTTTIACDNHEITNVLGLRAVELFHDAAQGLPLKVMVAMPVCVPSIPGFEDAGAVITDKEVTEAYRQGWAQLQGEQMNFPGLIYGDPGVHAITQASLREGKVLTGHYSSPEIKMGLQAFVAAGIAGCHEATTAEEAMRRAELGCYAQQRYGTAWLDMPQTIRAVLDNPDIDTRFFTLITDDVTPATIVEDGHLSRVVRDAIKEGLDPIRAYQMVTINAAQLLEKARWIGTVSPGRAADILILSSLEQVVIDQVYVDGVLVAEKGKMAVEFAPHQYPDWALNSVHVAPISAADLRIPFEGAVAQTRVMRIYPGKVHTTEEIMEIPAVGGALQADAGRDLAKVAVFYRHEAKVGDDALKGFGFVTGIGFKEDVAFGSTVAHDCHNLMVMGTSDAAMVKAANALIEARGGMVVVVGDAVTLLPMPLAGLMSLDSAQEVTRQLHTLEAAFRAAGSDHPSVEMTLSLIPLIVLVELHVSNRGLVALKPGQPPAFVDLVMQ
ncbi:MAG: amidohydrolase family protein [Anaerolineae bacterium]|nr:amidohydrolase family protein [Anaerolineae bacterium]NUQ05914.1 adenine deaminase [Anaerolineae bacterium]